ncbi:MAG: DUF2791 family P-loop domain-containing protein [Ilumatobacteraceae bacterium]
MWRRQKRRRASGGDLDHDGAIAFLAGLLTILRGAGYSGLVLVLDEIETLCNGSAPTPATGHSTRARQLIDEIDQGRFPGLYLVITGTPAFFDGPQGASRLPPLAQRLHTDFTTDVRFDNPRAIQLRLPGFDIAALCEVGRRVRDLYADGSEHGQRLRATCDDAHIETLARAVTGNLGGCAGIAPRLFLKKLVADVLDRVDQFADFDPPTTRSPCPTANSPRSSATSVRPTPWTTSIWSSEEGVRLRPAAPLVQHHVVNSLGWRSLRPLQAATIDFILHGDHAGDGPPPPHG